MINFQEKASQVAPQKKIDLNPASLKSTGLRAISERVFGHQAPSFITLTHKGRYFDTRQQVELRDVSWFEDEYEASIVSGSSTVTGLFSRSSWRGILSGSNSSVHPTSSFVTDSSGATRKILSPDIDFYSSGSVDAYRNGVELMRDNQWTAGLIKISAGTPGHLLERLSFGIPVMSVIDPDVFYEVDTFDPVKYVESGGDPESFTYPIVTTDRNLLENEVMDGIIEPMPIRPVISNFSTYFPFEPRGVRAHASEGNTNVRGYTDVILGVSPRDVGSKSTWFIDDCDPYGVTNETSGTFVGVIVGRINDAMTDVASWIDEHKPRGRRNDPTLYNDQMIAALNALPAGGDVYVPDGSLSATCGFVFEGSGTDSIVYGGRTKT